MMKYIIFIVLLVISIVGIIFYKDIIIISRGEKFDFKIYMSPKNKSALTLMLHTNGAGLNYHSYIYLIPGKYDQKRLPNEENYIKFPDGTGVIINWKKEDEVEVLCDSKPAINKFTSNNYKIKLFVSRDHFDSLINEGKKDSFIRYTIK